jgi:hypothetical protein
LVTHSFSEAELGEQFTVVILSMAERVAMLEQVLHEYDGLPIIAEIIVVMNGLIEDHVASRLGVIKTPISFVNNSVNSLNNRYNNKHSLFHLDYELTHSFPHTATRFAVADKVKTEAVLANDDDLFFTPKSAAYLFRVQPLFCSRSLILSPRPSLTHVPSDLAEAPQVDRWLHCPLQWACNLPAERPVLQRRPHQLGVPAH